MVEKTFVEPHNRRLIQMESRHLVGLTLLVIAVFATTAGACLSRRLRDAAFFLMIGSAVFAERIEINFFGRWWYRGSTRGVEIAFVDIFAFAVFISSLLPALRNPSRVRWPASLGLMLLFIVYAFGSTLTIEPRLFGIFELSKLLRGVLYFLAAALFVRSERELSICVLALCCAVLIQGASLVKQKWFEGLDRVAGTLGHPNSLSMYLCMTAPIFVVAINSTLPRFVRWSSAAALGCAAFSSILTVSRAGVPTFALVVLGATAWSMTWRITFKKMATVAIVLVAAGLGGAKFWHNLQQRYEESTLSDEYLDQHTIDSRGYFLRLARIMVDDRFFGVGLNNWSYAVSKKYGKEVNTPYADYDSIPADLNSDEDLNLSFAAPAHNLCALTVGELGVPGLIIFLLLWIRWFQMGAVFLWRRKRTGIYLMGIGIFFGMLGVFLQSLTEWIFRQTPIFLTFHVLVGMLATLYFHRKEERAACREPAPVKAPELELATVSAN